MKSILAAAVLSFVLVSQVFAHEKHGDRHSQKTGEAAQESVVTVRGELQMMRSHLRQPEYLHMLLNPLPLYGMAAGVFMLAVAMFRRDLKEQMAALLWIALVGAVTGLVIWYGQKGYDHVYPALDTVARRWLDVHMERGETLMYLFYAAALTSLATLWARRKFPKAARVLAGLTLGLAVLCVGAAGWISHAGGQVRHSEFRVGPPSTGPLLKESHHHP